MNSIQYAAGLSYKAVKLNEISMMEGTFEVTSFAVKGGAKRLIELSSTDEVSLISEFEQARSFKNLIVFLSAGDIFSVNDLRHLVKNNQSVSINFGVTEYRNKIFSQTLLLTCEKAKIVENPRFISDSTESYVSIFLEIPDPKISRTSSKAGKFTNEDW